MIVIQGPTGCWSKGEKGGMGTSSRAENNGCDQSPRRNYQYGRSPYNETEQLRQEHFQPTSLQVIQEITVILWVENGTTKRPVIWLEQQEEIS
jgi:hypothetical protein